MIRGVAIVALSLGLVLAGCRAPVRNYSCTIEPDQVDVDVHGVWSCNRDVLRRAARGKKFSIDELRSAVRFFEQVTGLRVDTRGTHVGVLPGEGIHEDIEDLDAWYTMHRERLRWDREAATVVLDTVAATGGTH